MSDASGPVCCRFPPEDRERIAAVAHHLGVTLSDFLRLAARALAEQVTANATADNVDIVTEYRAAQERRAAFEASEARRRRR